MAVVVGVIGIADFALSAAMGISIVSTFIKPISNWTDARCARKVSEHPYLGSTVQRVVESIPTITGCTFSGCADLPPWTDEAYVTCDLHSPIETQRLQFHLLGRNVYPASPRTKFVLARLETCWPQSVPTLGKLFAGAPDNTTRCAPPVLEVVPLKQ